MTGARMMQRSKPQHRTCRSATAAQLTHAGEMLTALFFLALLMMDFDPMTAMLTLIASFCVLYKTREELRLMNRMHAEVQRMHAEVRVLHTAQRLTHFRTFFDAQCLQVVTI